MPDSNKIQAVPTNVITGFLGAGKSTSIFHLLERKPDDERWAVLVNEFGEVGIDGSFFSGREGEEKGVFINEVPGGCMCCTAGVPMQVALNTLLSQSRPHRLLIEPTGLGHPQEVLDTLTADQHRQTIDLRATITLVDARKVRDTRYTNHPTFNQQLEVADLIVASKADRYAHDDYSSLLDYLERTVDMRAKSVHQIEHGALDLDWLETPVKPTQATGNHRHGHSHSHDHDLAGSSATEPRPIPDEGYMRIDNEGEGYYSSGWVFSRDWTFDRDQLHSLFLGVNADRIKGVFATDHGLFAYNKVDEALTEFGIEEVSDSRVEVISTDRTSFGELETALLGCVTHRS